MTLSSTVTTSFFAALSWAAEKDAAYRDAQELRNAPDNRLDDMGLSRVDVGRLQPADDQPSVLGASNPSTSKALSGRRT